MATLSVAESETSVRNLVAADLAALPQSFGDPSKYRQTIVRFYCDQVAQQVAAGVFAVSPADVATVAQVEVARMIREELLRRTS